MISGIRNKFLIILVVFACCFGTAKGQWYCQNPVPTGNHLYSVHFENMSDGWMAGSSGTLYHYNGYDWLLDKSAPLVNLNSIYFNSGKNGYIVGNGGLIMNYDGSGWLSQSSKTTQNLHSVFMLDALHVYAAGDKGTILQNSGSGWSKLGTNYYS